MEAKTKKRPVSIKEIADFVGVHRTTASKVLNDDGNCKVALVTRRRILKAAQDLGFSREHNLRVPSRTLSFGLISCARSYDRRTNPFYSDVFDGINVEAHRQGINIYMINNIQGLSLGQLLAQQKFAGVVDLGTITAEKLASFELAGKPLIGVEAQHHISSSILYTIHTDFAAGTRKAADYLISVGHRRIYYIGFGVKGREDAGCFERFEGVAAALKAAGLYDPGCRIIAEQSDEGSGEQTAVSTGYRGMKSLLERQPVFPLACVCYSDLHAVGVYKAAGEMGLRIPEDVSVVGYDNIPQSEEMDPPLSTINVPRLELGRRAVQLLLDLERGTAPHETIVPSELVTRASILPM
jgi:DNA-binding LacI/PurR family transcriptional regulator